MAQTKFQELKQALKLTTGRGTQAVRDCNLCDKTTRMSAGTKNIYIVACSHEQTNVHWTIRNAGLVSSFNGFSFTIPKDQTGLVLERFIGLEEMGGN